MQIDVGNASSFHYAIDAVAVAFVAVVAVALERFYKDRTLVEAQEFGDRRCFLFGWRCYEVFYWSVLTVLVSLGLRFLIGSAVHLHGTLEESRGPVRDLLWDILWLFIFGSFIVRAALAKNVHEFAKWLMSFSVAGVLWSVIGILVSSHALTSSLAFGWLFINGAQFVATLILWVVSRRQPQPAGQAGQASTGNNEQVLVPADKRVLRMLALAFVFGVLFIVDVCHMLDGSFGRCILSVLHCSVTQSASPPDKTEWHFVVSGDSRNCGDLIMPAIARGASRDQAAFYWHLGDFRAIYEYDEDMLSRKSMDFSDYTKMAWDDFLQMQIAPFQAAHLPVFLGIGNHETIPPKTRGEYVARFADWLDSPALKDQRLADDPNAHEPRTYYHWKQAGIDFIYLDNASDDQFDKDQMKWFNRVLKNDVSDSGVKSIVVGMHKALPDSLGNWHSMGETPQGIYSGRCVYKSLASAQAKAHKQVYVLASHSHFYMEDIYNTEFWHKHAEAVLPGWIIGTAGAVRYRLPPNPPKNAQADVYGYLLATVNAEGQPGVIRFEFREIPKSDDIPAEVRQLFSRDLVNFCFDQNKELKPAGTLPEPPDGPCPEPD